VTNYPPTADEDYIRNLFKSCGEVFSIRFPSLKFNTHRRFCYVSFEDQQGAAKATGLDGKLIDGKYKLLSKYSDPAGKKKREGAVAEGRELRVKNISQKTTEDDLRAVFEKHGTVESIKIIKNIKGQNRGTAFAVMGKKEEAENAALSLNKAQLGSNIIDVELSKDTNYKPTASNKASSPEGGAVEMTSDMPSRAQIEARSMAILGLPDTVNDARVRALAEEHGGDVVKIVLRPDRGGAIVEFKEASIVGKAMMAINDYEIAPNRKLHTGTVDELFKDGKAQIKNSSLMPPTHVRRPTLVTGQKKKQRVGFPAAPAGNSTEDSNIAANPKSNADFKALFLGNKQ
jgi:RNA recognition motif-containing protein